MIAPAAAPADCSGARAAGTDDPGLGPDRPRRRRARPTRDLEDALPKAARRYLARELGWTPRPTPPVAVDEIRLAPSRLPEEARTAARRAARRGERPHRPRVAAAPGRRQELPGPAAPARGRRLRRPGRRRAARHHRRDGRPARRLQRARRRRRPLRRGHERGRRAGRHRPRRPAVGRRSTCRRMASVQALDVPSSLVTVGPGMRGPALEQALDREGLTFGHLPQSWEFATVGGYAATRSAGQNSTGVGRFDELVAGLTLATPSGVLELGHPPASAAGPDLLGLALGSEGTLGVITELTPAGAPQAGRPASYEGWSFRSWAAGLAALQQLAPARPAARHRPALRPRRDPRQPAHGRRHRRPGRCAARSGPAGTATAACSCSAGRGCPRSSGPGRSAAAALLRDGGAIRLGHKVGESWKSHRFQAPYLRDKLHGRRPAGGDPGDRGHLDGAAHRLRRRPPGPAGVADPRGTASAGHEPRLARLPDRRLAVRHRARRPRRRRCPSSSGSPPSGRRPTRCWPPAARSPTTTPSAPTTGPGWSARSGRSASRCCARSSSAWTRRASATPASCCPNSRAPQRLPGRSATRQAPARDRSQPGTSSTDLMARHRVPGCRSPSPTPSGCCSSRPSATRTWRRRRPVTPETRFLWFSMSKIVTATAAMALVDAGQLDLDAPVDSVVPGFRTRRAPARWSGNC